MVSRKGNKLHVHGKGNQSNDARMVVRAQGFRVSAHVSVAHDQFPYANSLFLLYGPAQKTHRMLATPSAALLFSYRHTPTFCSVSSTPSLCFCFCLRNDALIVARFCSSDLSVMTSSNDTLSPYIASVNPPRRAKRARTDSLLAVETSAAMEITPSAAPKRRARPHILPKGPLDTHAMDDGDSDSGEGEEDDYDPSLSASAPKRRGRKPGAMSRSARESLRKLNHSRIEKARRTKINETLGTLSALVNEAEMRKRGPQDNAEASRDDNLKGKRAGKGKSEEGKEFKLDVLVKAVSYMQELIEKVRQLESRACETCSSSVPAASSTVHHDAGYKRKRVEDDVDEIMSDMDTKDAHSVQDEDDSYIGDDEKNHLTTAFDEHHSPASAFSSRPSASPRLPPIASWLPHPYIDPSRLATISESQGPAPGSSSQLPSPPPSGRFRPAQSGLIMPPLTLPGPAHPLPLAARFSPSATRNDAVLPPPPSASISTSAVMSVSTSSSTTIPSRRHSLTSDSHSHPHPHPRPHSRPHSNSHSHSQSNAHSSSHGRGAKAPTASPSVSPTWTPEDENAATLLLQMSSSPSSSASISPSTVPPLSLAGSTPLERSPKSVHMRSSPQSSSRAVGAGSGVERAMAMAAGTGQSEVIVHMQAETPSSLLGLARD